MADNPKFRALLQEMQAVHASKNGDYCGEGESVNPYQNFEDAAATAGCSVDTVFQVMIGIKLARLKALLGGNRAPNHESVQDSRLDLAMYAALWCSYQMPWSYDDQRANPRHCACGQSALVNGARCRHCEAVVSER